MKKVVSLVLAVVMIAALAVSAAAAPSITEWVKILSISEGTTVSKVSTTETINGAQMMAAVEASEGVVPEDITIKHLTVMQVRKVTNNVAPIDIELRTWGTSHTALCLFFRGVEETEWTLVACNPGEVIEAELPGNGYYAVAMAW